MTRITQLAAEYWVPSALRKVAFLFETEDRAAILSAAATCEQTQTLESIEAARNAVHTAAHRYPQDSAAYAAGHAAAYAAAAAYVAFEQAI